MKRFWILAVILVLFTTFVAAPTSVNAQDGRTVFGEPVTVESGETVDGDVVAFGGPVAVERGGVVEGDLVALGGPVTIAGRVDGDVVSWGGPVDLAETAVVVGDVVTAGGPLRRSSGAVVEGDVVEGIRFEDFGDLRFQFPGIPTAPPIPGVPVQMGNGGGFFGFFLNLLGIGFKAAGLAVIALLVLIFLPEHTHRVKQMSIDQPVASIGVGILTMVVAALVLGVLVITICGIPVALVLGLALVMAGLFGWIAVGLLVGERLIAALNTGRPLPLIAGAVGVLIITLLSSVPCLGWLIGFLGGSWGLGAVVLSRGGTRDYPSLPGGRAWPAPTPPAAPEAPTEPQVVEPPAAPPEPAAEGLDDLQAIHGIGPVYEGMLREAGIRTYRDLAARSPQEVVEAVSGPDVISISEEAARGWIEEARRLAEEQRS